MRILLGSFRASLYEKIKEFAKNETVQFHEISNEFIDEVYRYNPDIIFFDTALSKKIKLWNILKTLTTAPSTREFPIIAIIKRKTSSCIKKICSLEVFDYLVEPFLECEFLMKLNKAMEIVELKKEFAKLLIKDPLTGAYNRGFIMERLTEELRWCSLYKEPLTLAMFDIDFFKKINDTFGHLTGDKMLMEVVYIALKFLPDRVILGRYGGEEFCVLMPSTNEKEAMESLEEFRKEVEKTKFHALNGRLIKLTISIGFTTFYGEEDILPDEIVQKADIAVYKAKLSGRNTC